MAADTLIIYDSDWVGHLFVDNHAEILLNISGTISIVIFNLIVHSHALINAHHQRAQWLSGRVLDSRPRGCWFEPQRHHCVVYLSKTHLPLLVLVQPRKTCPNITEKLLI